MRTGQAVAAALGFTALTLVLGALLKSPILSFFPPPDYPSGRRCEQGSIIGSEEEALLRYEAYVRGNYSARSEEWMLPGEGNINRLTAGKSFDLRSRQWSWIVGNSQSRDPKGRVIEAWLDVCGNVERIDVLN